MRDDDDLKIELSDIFGGDISDVKETVEKSEQAAADIKGLSAGERESIEGKKADERTRAEQEAFEKLSMEKALREKEEEVERKYREMLAARERELEERTRELERRLQQIQSRPTSPPPASIHEEDLGVVPEEPLAPVPAPPEPPKPAVDFDAPMPMPFSHAAPPPTAEPATPSASADEAPVETPQATTAEDLARLKRDHEFLNLYDEFRNILFLELNPLVGERKSKTMLSRSVELAMPKFPDVLRKANWDMEGNLIDDGRLDDQRLLENRNTLDPAFADSTLNAALGTLLSLRLQAVEKGLGTGMKSKVRSRMVQWISEKIEKTLKQSGDIQNLYRLRDMIPS